MPQKKRFIDVVSTSLRFPEESNQISFADILRFMDNKKFRGSEKIFELSLHRTRIQNCIVGIVVTTQDKDIPPIKDKRTGQYSRVNINPVTQGLAFANVFLYDISRNILLYEINRNGCFLKQLIEFIYSAWNEDNEDIRFDLSFPTIIRANEYNRMLQMDYYKKIIIDLYNPNELIGCFNEENDSIENNILRHNIQAGISSNANIIRVEQLALTKKLNPLGLSRGRVKGMIDAIKLNIVSKGFRENVHTLKIEGYSSDGEDSRGIKPVNILADTFHECFKIDDIQIQSDVQPLERKAGIERLYNKLLPEFRLLAR